MAKLRKLDKSEKLGFFKSAGYLVVGSALLGGLLTGSRVFYNKEVLYPKELSIKGKETGLYAIKEFQKKVNTGTEDSLFSNFSNSYLGKEIPMQNSNQDRIDFISSVLSTVNYKSLPSNQLNKYGSDYYEEGAFGKAIKVDSLVETGVEKVELSYIDYSQLEFNREEILALLENGEELGTSTSREVLANLFSRYVRGIVQSGDYPTTAVTRKVYLESADVGFRIHEYEDMYLDNILFESDTLLSTFDRFSEVVLGEEFLVESEEHKEWSNSKEKDKLEEPYKWDKHNFLTNFWLGINTLSEGTGEVIYPIGDGSFENPASLGTMVYTKAYVEGEEEPIDIRVTLTKISYGSDAIKDLIALDTRNRGIDPKSTNKYVYYEWKVENITNKEVRLFDNSSLADARGNVTGRTGNMYGLPDRATLPAYSWTTFHSWSNSTDLTEKYLVWGKDFERRVPLVWFKVLQLSDEEVVILEEPIQTQDTTSVENEETEVFD